MEYKEFLFKITNDAKKQFQIIKKLKNIIHYENWTHIFVVKEQRFAIKLNELNFLSFEFFYSLK